MQIFVQVNIMFHEISRQTCIFVHIYIYSFIKSQVTYPTCLQLKYRLYEIRPTDPARATMQENQPAAQIAASHYIFPQMEPNMSGIFLVLVGIDPGVSRLDNEIVICYHGCATITVYQLV